MHLNCITCTNGRVIGIYFPNAAKLADAMPRITTGMSVVSSGCIDANVNKCVGIDVILRYGQPAREITFYAARVFALLHDTPRDVGSVENLCALVQWYSDVADRRSMRECLIGAGISPDNLQLVTPSGEVSGEAINSIVAHTHMFAIQTDSRS